MPTTASVQIGDQTYTLTSPTIGALDAVEAVVGPLTDPAVINTIRCRIQLIYACLLKVHPEITPGVIRTWDVADYARLLEAMFTVCPLWGSASADAASSPGSSSPAPASSDGPPAPPAASS